MNIREVPDAGLLEGMRKQFSYSLFIFMLTASLVVSMATGVFKRLTTTHIAVTLIAYSVLQGGIYLTFLTQNRELSRRLKHRQ